MFLKKTERKKHSVCAILTVGALAAIGAVSITRCGKQLINDMVCKVKRFLKKERNMCSIESENE